VSAATQTVASDKLPLIGLSALALAGFLTILTEALPAGLLPAISADLGVSQAMAGQMITAYAMGSLLSAIPLTVATRGWQRRPLLLVAIGGFLVVNAVTALSTSYMLTMVARFAAGVFAGLVWALVAGYASRMAPSHMTGRAMAVAMVGTPLALSIGIPAGTLLGGLVGWRTVFLMLSGLSILLVGWIAWRLPDFAGEPSEARRPLAGVLALPGLKPVLAATLGFVLAHNILYTYIAPFLERSGLGERADAVLMLFGVSALVGVWIAGLLIDHWLRSLTLVSTVVFAASALAIGLAGQAPGVVIAAVAAWGVAFGGAPTFFQTASARVAGDAADVAQSMIVTSWNLAIAGGGLVGGVMLQAFGAGGLPWSLIVVLALVGWQVRASREGFRE
jgi:predicted MFS family arabinose efflux permease